MKVLGRLRVLLMQLTFGALAVSLYLMGNEYRYVVFEAGGGWFGLFGTENAVLRTSLPMASRADCEGELLGGIEAEFDAGYFKSVQDRIASYYNGMGVDFSDVGVELSGLGEFARRVLGACRDVPSGETLTYGQIAAAAGSSKAARAAGTALASNPVPLIIPCHRIICASGETGKFSGAGGEETKKKMLNLEQPFRLRCTATRQVGR